jgi:enamine deaminase RidA (YjgF/YER057c/UK114 family)
MRTGPAARPGPGFANVGRALAAAGAGPRQVAKITIYVAGHRHEYLPAIDAARARPVCGPQRADTVMGRDASRACVLTEAGTVALIDR